VDRGHCVADGESSKLFTVRGEESIGRNDQSGRPQLRQGCEQRIKVSLGTGVQDMELRP
jgi:hypothetical protein